MDAIIKWSGSKRKMAHNIISYFGKNINVYYEPFCGSASVCLELINSNINFKSIICSDINVDLINLWNMIIMNPYKIIEKYYKLWNRLNMDNDLERKKIFFNKIRDKFNKYRKPEYFMFIMRTTYNGMPRYNKNKNFNGSFHINRNGIKPEKLEKLIIRISQLLNNINIKFKCNSFLNINSKNKNDVIFLDPPYFNTKGMYYNEDFDYHTLWNWIRLQHCRCYLTFDGKVNDINMPSNIPKGIFGKHIYLNSGNSSFRRILGKNKYINIHESLYIKGDK